jgi:mannose-6-phosphate isomerase-like protein (cupin superfamily)
MRRPSVVSLSEVQRRPRAGYEVARLIDRGGNGSELLMGVEWFSPGVRTSWSFAAEDDGEGEWFGERHETYYVLAGRLRLSWGEEADEVLEFGAGDGVHIPPGHRYVIESVGEETAEVVYAIAPSL